MSGAFFLRSAFLLGMLLALYLQQLSVSLDEQLPPPLPIRRCAASLVIAAPIPEESPIRSTITFLVPTPPTHYFGMDTEQQL